MSTLGLALSTGTAIPLVGAIVYLTNGILAAEFASPRGIPKGTEAAGVHMVPVGQVAGKREEVTQREGIRALPETSRTSF